MLTLWKTDSAYPSILTELDRLAHGVAGAGPRWSAQGLAPAVDILETEAGFEVTVDLPGVDPKAIQLQVENETLTVQAERRQPEAPKDGAVHRAERPWGAFHRSFALPGTVDGARVEARYDAGVLTVTLPKREEAKPRTIQVKAA